MLKLLLFLLLLLSGCSTEEDKNNTVVVGMSMDFPPFGYVNNGKPVGFEVDLLNEIGKIIDKKIVILDIHFAEIIANLNADKIDIGVSGFNVTEDRKKVVDFSNCYYYPKTIALFNKKTAIKEESDLNNNKIGVQTGTTMEIYLKNLKKKYSNIKIHSLSSNQHLLQELKIGRIDALLLEDGQIIGFWKSNPDIFDYAIIEKNDSFCYSMIFTKKSDLKEKVNDAIDILQQNGKLKEIEKHWLEHS